jgi:hypothetical protein
MNLQEQISRIQTMMGTINESSLPLYIKRRINFSKDRILKELKEYILRSYEPNKKGLTISKAFSEESYKILNSIELGDDEHLYQEFATNIKKHLENEFSEDAESIYDSIFGGNDDDETYIFYKHTERSGGGNGFSESVKGWFNFLSMFGYWFPDLDWNKIKERLDSNPGRFLIKNPLEGHPYHYYFSISKK